jgi:4-hydroxybutyrate CoA-transferase
VLNIGVKYCGGCNPRYDRKKFLNDLKKGVHCNFEMAQLDKVYDMIIILCGCTSCCADYNGLKFRLKKILVKSREDFNEVENLLNQYSSKM